MERVKLTNNKRNILQQLAEYKYPNPVPDKDIKDFLELEDLGFVNHLKLSQGSLKQLYGPQITDTGRRYLAENPKLKNPRRRFDWKWWIGTIIALLGVITTMWAVLK